MSASFGWPAALGGFPAIGSGRELNVTPTQAGGAATKGYVGIVGQARQTWIRECFVLSNVSANQQFYCLRGISGHALLPITPFLLQGNGTPLMQVAGGPDQTVLTFTKEQLLWNFPLAFTGQFNFAASDFLGPPLVLAKGDALLALAGTVNVTASLTVFAVEID